MKIIMTDLNKITFSLESEPQWLASYQEKLKNINFMELDGDLVTFDTKRIYEKRSILEIVNMIDNFQKDNPDVEITYEGPMTDHLKDMFGKELEMKNRIQESYQFVLNDLWEEKQLNKEFWRDDFEPYDFQLDHAQKLISKVNSANFSSPGAGKTIISFMAIASLFADKEIQDVVVFGPKSASIAWGKEWKYVMKEKHVSQRNISYLDFSNKRADSIKTINPKNWPDSKLNIWFFNFHKMSNLDFVDKLTEILEKRRFILIIDEAHYIKNKVGKWHSAIATLSSFAKYSLVLTGTPLPRFASEGNYLVNIMWPNIEHKNLSDDDFKEFGEGENPNLKAYFSHIFSRKNKKDLEANGELKKLNKIDVNINMTKMEEMLVKSFLSSQRSNLLDEHTCYKMNKALLIRRMQASSYPPLLKEPMENVIKELREDLFDALEDKENDSYDIEENEKTLNEVNKPSSKKVEEFIQKTIESSEFRSEILRFENKNVYPERWEKALEIIKENNENIVVWDIFRKSMSDFRTFLRNKLGKARKIIIINGSVTGDQRINRIEEFKNSKNAILIASPATIAESVSLHKRCHIAIYLYKNYVGSHWMQSIDRIHRLVSPSDESKEKYIYNIISAGNSIDQMIMKNLNEKERQQSKLID